MKKSKIQNHRKLTCLFISILFVTLFESKTIAQAVAADTSNVAWVGESQEEGLRLNNLGSMENGRGNYENALNYLNDAIRLWHKAMFYNNRAIAYLGLEKYREALSDANMAVALDSSDYKNWHERGEASHSLKNNNEAISDFTKAISLTPNPTSYQERGETYIDLLNYLAAYEDFHQVLNMEPNYDDAVYFNDFGYIANKLEKYSEAIKYLLRATQLNPGVANTYDHLGEAYYKLQQYDDSYNSYQQCLKLDPTRDMTKSYLEQVKRILGKQ